MTFRKNIIGQINKLRQQKLRREIRVTDVTALPKNDFKRWNDDGREWREAVLECCSLERIVSSQNEEVKHEIYRKKACLRVLQSRHIRSSDQEGKRENYYFCSEFVSEVLINSGIFNTDKKPEEILPLDLLAVENKTLIYEGYINKLNFATETLSTVI